MKKVRKKLSKTEVIQGFIRYPKSLGVLPREVELIYNNKKYGLNVDNYHRIRARDFLQEHTDLKEGTYIELVIKKPNEIEIRKI